MPQVWKSARNGRDALWKENEKMLNECLEQRNKKAEGCDFIEWINGSTEALDEDCPTCGEKLVLYTTSTGKKMKKCSTSGWDSAKRAATGCPYVQWLKSGDYPRSNEPNGEEFLPPEPQTES